MRRTAEPGGGRAGMKETKPSERRQAKPHPHMKAIGGLRDYTQVSESLTNMEGKRLLRLPA